jgi:hypothetical protein
MDNWEKEIKRHAASHSLLHVQTGAIAVRIMARLFA